MTTNDKDRFTIYLDNAIRHKLQILADSDDMRLGSYIKQILEQTLADFEEKILDVYGRDEFLENYHAIFGHDYPPLIEHDVEVEFDEELARRNLITYINAAPRNKGARMVGVDHSTSIIGVRTQSGKSFTQRVGRGARETGNRKVDFNVDLEELLEQQSHQNKQEPSDE